MIVSRAYFQQLWPRKNWNTKASGHNATTLNPRLRQTFQNRTFCKHQIIFASIKKKQESGETKKVVDKFISDGDWVLKRKPNAETSRKLQSKWDGPYLVLYSNRLGSYHLSDLEGNELQHPWKNWQCEEVLCISCKKARLHNYKQT